MFARLKMRALVIFFSTAVYSGYAPVAPGTAGSVVGLVLVWVAFAPLWKFSPIIFLVVFAALFVIACFIADEAERVFEEHDSPHIVIDEVLGMTATLFLVPLSWPYVIGGFIVFRAFDVLKLFPANVIDRRMQGGLGVMLDDLVVGIYANIVLQIIHQIVLHLA